MPKRRFYSEEHLKQMIELDAMILFIDECRTQIELCVEPSLISSHTAKGARRWLDPLHEALDELEHEAFNIDERVRGELFE